MKRRVLEIDFWTAPVWAGDSLDLDQAIDGQWSPSDRVACVWRLGAAG